jgi:hypothetical protein
MSTLVLFLAVWIVLPAPTYPLLILAIGAAEIAPWLIAVAAGTAMIALIRVPPTKVARITLLLSAVAFALSALPLLRFPKTARHFDQAMQTTLGDDFLCAVPAEIRRDLRTNPLDPIALFTGLKAGTPHITRGIPFATHDGAALTLDVYRPPSSGRYPAVVQIHGGAWQRGTPGDNAAFAADLAAHHFVVFAIDYRHAPRWRWPAQRARRRAATTTPADNRHAVGVPANPLGRARLRRRTAGPQRTAGALSHRAFSHLGPLVLRLRELP